MDARTVPLLPVFARSGPTRRSHRPSRTGCLLGDVHELAFVPAMDLPETYKYETIHVLQALLKSLDGSDTVVRARSVAGDRLLPTSKWHLHNWRPGPDDFAFFPEKEHLDVHRLAPAVLVGEL